MTNYLMPFVTWQSQVGSSIALLSPQGSDKCCWPLDRETLTFFSAWSSCHTSARSYQSFPAPAASGRHRRQRLVVLLWCATTLKGQGHPVLELSVTWIKVPVAAKLHAVSAHFRCLTPFQPCAMHVFYTVVRTCLPLIRFQKKLFS